MTINLYALWRNSEGHILRTFRQLDDLLSLDFKFNLFFYTNDNKDQTLRLLTDWAKTKKQKIEIRHETLEAPSFGSVTSCVRMSLMAYYRNQCKRLGLKTISDFSLVMDTDLEFSKEDFLSLYKNLPLNAAGITGSTMQNVPDFTENSSETSFYDIAPFRDSFGTPGCYFSATPFFLNADRQKFLSGDPVEIASGFGGMALYKSEFYDLCWYSGEANVEHVSLSYQLRKFGALYVDPNCQPFADINLDGLDMDYCRQVGRRNLETMRAINNLKECSLAESFEFEFSEK